MSCTGTLAVIRDFLNLLLLGIAHVLTRFGGHVTTLFEHLAELASDAGRACPEVVCLGGLPVDDPTAGSDQLHALAEIGVTRFVAGGGRYNSIEEFKPLVDGVSAIREALG